MQVAEQDAVRLVLAGSDIPLTEKSMENPFRLSFYDSAQVVPSVVVIFGSTGDLTHRKLVPALYNLGVDGLLPAQFSLVGFARREMSDDAFRTSFRESVQEHSRRSPLDESVWREFAEHSHYVMASFDEPEGYTRLRELLNTIDQQTGVRANHIFYFATAPEYFEIIARNLKAAGLLDPGTAHRHQPVRSRVVIEKPFGHDLQSARKLNQALLECMEERQIYRIDHYLGKETVQNLLVFRFANGIFEPVWNHKYIDHVEISVCESIGLAGRAGYFDKAGILRDIVQNHALQLLCLVALEPPVAFEADAVRDEKVKVLRSIRPIPASEVARTVVRGRYQMGYIAGQRVEGYLAEPGVDPNSTSETYVAMELALDSWRWAGVPFFVRAGKRLPKRVTEISIHFRQVPHTLFREESVDNIRPNILSFQIQPDEGIALKMSAKPPGTRLSVQSVNMDFSYGTSFGLSAPDAYERLLLDAMRGDPTLFTRDDEIEQSWAVLDGVLDAWSEDRGKRLPVYGYEAGTWGPVAADELLVKRIGRGWRRL